MLKTCNGIHGNYSLSSYYAFHKLKTKTMFIQWVLLNSSQFHPSLILRCCRKLAVWQEDSAFHQSEDQKYALCQTMVTSQTQLGNISFTKLHIFLGKEQTNKQNKQHLSKYCEYFKWKSVNTSRKFSCSQYRTASLRKK